MRKVLLLLAGVLLLWTAGAARETARAAETFKYLIDELPPIPHPGTETWQTTAYAINNRDQMVGVSTKKDSSIFHATLWEFKGGQWVITDLGNLGGLGGSVAAMINDAGVVAGWSYLPNGMTHAFRWDPVSRMQDLDAGDTKSIFSKGLGINSKGWVAGYFRDSQGDDHPCRWKGPGSREQLGKLTGTPPDKGVAYAINAGGTVAGNAWVYNPADRSATDHAALWFPGGYTDLGTLKTGYESFGYAINKAGQVVGKSNLLVNQEHPYHAVIWNGAAPTDLQTLGGEESQATAINNQGAVVGWSHDKYGSKCAFLWEPGKGMIDLNYLISQTQQYHWNLLTANGINDDGLIVGVGTYDGKLRGFLLSPVKPIAEAITQVLLMLLLSEP